MASEESNLFARRASPRPRRSDSPRGVAADVASKTKDQSVNMTAPATPSSVGAPDFATDPLDFDVDDPNAAAHPTAADDASNQLPSPSNSMHDVEMSSGPAGAGKDELDILQQDGRPMYGTAPDGARLTHKPPKPTHFVRRKDGLVSALIAIDELPPFMGIPHVPRVMSEADMASCFANPTVVPGMFPRSLHPYEPINSFKDSTSSSGVPQNGQSGNDFGFGGPSQEAGFGAAPPQSQRLVPTDKDWEAHTGKYVDMLHQQWREAGRIVPGNNSGQIYNPRTPGVFGRKIFCSHWIRTGECDFTQQGCNYLHRMPDLATMAELGMKSYPRWIRELPRAEQIHICTDFDPKGLQDAPPNTRGGPRRQYNFADKNDRAANQRDRRQRKHDARRAYPHGSRPAAAYPMGPPPQPGMAPGPQNYNPPRPAHFAPPYQNVPSSHGQAQFNAPQAVPYDTIGRAQSPLVSEFNHPANWQYSRPATPAGPGYVDNSPNLIDIDTLSMHGGQTPMQFTKNHSRRGSVVNRDPPDVTVLTGGGTSTIPAWSPAAIREPCVAYPRDEDGS